MELYLHSTHLHVHGVVLKLRMNLEFLNLSKTKELLQRGNETFSRVFTKLRKATISFVISVRPSVRLSVLDPTGRILMKFDI